MNEDWDTTTYLTKNRPQKGSSNEKTAIRQASRAGTLETRQKIGAGTNQKGNTAHHAKLDRETEELKHKVINIIFCQLYGNLKKKISQTK